MQRKKWLFIPFLINMFAIIITQLLVPTYDFVVEANPVNNFFYQSFGSFIFSPLWTIFILFVLYPIVIDLIIKLMKKVNENDMRKIFEWFMISCATVIFSVDLINNIYNYILITGT